MAYSQPKDLRNALAPGSWTDTEPDPLPKTHTAADLPDAQLVSAIAQGDQIIDGYISRFYTTPVSDEDVTRSPVKAWSIALGAYYATLSYRRSADLSTNDPVALRFAAAMAQILSVNKGAMSLPIAPQVGGSQAAGAGQVINQQYADPFGNDCTRWGYVPYWRDPYGTPANQLTAVEVGIIQRGLETTPDA